MRLNQLIALISASLGQALVIASAAQAQTAIPAGPSSPNALRVRPVANWIAPEPTAMGLPLPGLADQGPSGIPAGMTLAELEEIATACNPTLAQAAARIQALQGTQLQAGLYPNPVIGYVGEEMGAEGSAGQQGAFFGQTIVTAGKLGLNRAVVGHEIQQARRAWEVQLHRVLNDVRSRACEVLVAQRMIRLEEQLLRIGEVGVKTTEELLKAGEVGRVDVLLSRIEANSARLQLDNARNQYLAAWRRLTAVVGVPDMEPMPLVDELERDLPELSWEASFARLIAESPELAQARAGVQRAECAVAQACAERIPNLDIEGAVRQNQASGDTVATIQIGMPLQIFNRNQGNIARTQAELASAHSEVQRVELALQDRLADAFEQYANSRQQTQRYISDILPDATTTLELVRAGYEQGEFGYLELLTAQRTYFRASLAYVESLRELRLSGIRIEGMLMTGAIDSTSE